MSNTESNQITLFATQYCLERSGCTSYCCTHKISSIRSLCPGMLQ